MDISHHLQRKRRRVTNLESSESFDLDKISALPDCLIIRILGLLTTEETIPTAVLSKRWKLMWKKVRHLKFDSEIHQERFSDHLIAALVSYQNQFFESLTISVSRNCDPTELAIWLGIALIKNVSKMVFMLNKADQTLAFPPFGLRRMNTLKVLKLIGNIALDLPADGVTLQCLKELHLYHVSFENGNSVARLFEGCPLLLELVLDIYISSGVPTIIINVPSLLRLTLASHHCVEENIVIQTPCLKYLNTKKLDGVDSFIIEGPSHITEAIITRHEENMYENVLAEITLVQCLSLAAPLKLPMGKVFEDLISLEINAKEQSWCNLLSHMFACAPRIQTLRIVGGRYYRWRTSWIEPPKVGACLLTHLSTLVWEDLIWDGADDREVAVYILKNAAKLRNATFTTLNPPTNEENEQRQTILTLLANVERASDLCNLAFKESSIWKFNSSSSDDPDVHEFIF